MEKLFLIPLMMAALALGGCFESDDELLSKASALYPRDEARPENIKQALEIYSELAKKENPKALYMLARMYEIGDGVPRDDKKAFELFSKASALGLGDATLRISQNFISSEYGFKPDEYDQEKLFYIKKSSQQGSPLGKITYAQVLLTGLHGANEDPAESLRLLKTVAESTDSTFSSNKPYANFLIFTTTYDKESPQYDPLTALNALEALKGKGSPMIEGVIPYILEQIIETNKDKASEYTAKRDAALKELKDSKNYIALFSYDSFSNKKTDQLLPNLVLAAKSQTKDPFFDSVACSVIGKFVLADTKIVELDDILDSCERAAKYDNSLAHYILSALYVKKGNSEKAYYWAKIASLAGNTSGDDLAFQISAKYKLGADTHEIDKQAATDYKAIKLRGPTNYIDRPKSAWY